MSTYIHTVVADIPTQPGRRRLGEGREFPYASTSPAGRRRHPDAISLVGTLSSPKSLTEINPFARK